MKEGGTRVIQVPPALAYGEKGIKIEGKDGTEEYLVPPNERLQYEVLSVALQPVTSRLPITFIPCVPSWSDVRVLAWTADAGASRSAAALSGAMRRGLRCLCDDKLRVANPPSGPCEMIREVG